MNMVAIGTDGRPRLAGKVFGCVQGNSPICGKANQEMKPSAAMRSK